MNVLLLPDRGYLSTVCPTLRSSVSLPCSKVTVWLEALISSTLICPKLVETVSPLWRSLYTVLSTWKVTTGDPFTVLIDRILRLWSWLFVPWGAVVVVVA